MDLGSLFLVLAVILLVGVFVSRPLYQRDANRRLVERASAVQEAEHKRSALMAERDRIILALQDLEFDHVLGKIPPEDYPEQRAALLHSGADVLRQLDELGALGPAVSAEDRLEAAVAARRADAAVKAPPRRPAVRADEDEVEALVAARRKARQEKAGGFCPKCGKPVTKDDQFCSRCGAVLS